MTDLNISIANEYEFQINDQLKDVELGKDITEQFDSDPINNQEQNNEFENNDQEDNIKKSFSVEEKCIKNFVLGKTIGEGSFGKVKIGTHVLTKEKVAIKILDKTKFDDEDYKNINKEISVMKKVRHKNIIQLYEIIETEDKLYIIMEFAENGDFFNFISQNIRIYDEKQACKYFQQIINALEYIHSLNIVHRDIKPENMLLDFKNDIKLTDFGLSTSYSDYQLLTTPCGTPTYAPPEIFKGEEYHGIFTDIWSAGVVLYAMLSGYLPFGESNDNILQVRIVKGDFQIPDFISEDAKELLKGMLKVDPLERYDFELIKTSKWFTSINYIFYPGIFIDKHVLPIDEKILDLIENIYNIERKTVKFHLLNNDFNEFTTTYYMMLKRFIKEGGKSISDLISKEYLDYIQDSKNLYNYDNILEIKKEQESMDASDLQVVNQLIKNSSSVLSTIKINALITKARNSLNSYYIANRAKINENDILAEIEIENAINRPRKTIFKRTDNINTNIFLDLLERKTLKLAEKESTDCEKLLEDYIKKKNYIESHQRNSIKINFTNIGIIKDEISDNYSDISKNLSNKSINDNEDLKNINVDAVYEIPIYLEEIKKPPLKKKPKVENRVNQKKEKPKRVKIDPKKYNIYLNKKVGKKEKTPDKKQENNNNIIKIELQFPKKKEDVQLLKESSVNQQIAITQNSKGDNTTLETIIYKNLLNTSVNENILSPQNVKEGIEVKENNIDQLKLNYKTHYNYKKKPKATSTDKKSRSKQRKEYSMIGVESTRRTNKKKHDKTYSQDSKPNNSTDKAKEKPIRYQIKPVSKSPNKINAETFRSRSPNFNTNHYSDRQPEHLNNIVYTEEFITYLSTHNKLPYSTKKTRFNYTPIKNNLNISLINTETSALNNVTEQEEIKLKEYSGPIDFGCCFMIEAELLQKYLVKILTRFRIIYIKKQNYCLRCNKEGIKFKISFHYLKDSKISYIKFQRMQGTSFEYQQIVSKILLDLKMNV